MDVARALSRAEFRSSNPGRSHAGNLDVDWLNDDVKVWVAENEKGSLIEFREMKKWSHGVMSWIVTGAWVWHDPIDWNQDLARSRWCF